MKQIALDIGVSVRPSLANFLRVKKKQSQKKKGMQKNNYKKKKQKY